MGLIRYETYPERITHERSIVLTLWNKYGINITSVREAQELARFFRRI